MELSINIKAFKDEKVKVLNPRKSKEAWEFGKVSNVEIRIDGNKKLYAVYRIILDRKSKVRSRGVIMFVSEDNIERVKTTES